MNKDLIEALKKNERPFRLMSLEMRQKAKEIGKEMFEVYGGNGWHKAIDANWMAIQAYRLHPDYQEQPEIVECVIGMSRDGQCLVCSHHGSTLGISCAPDHPDFIGFKYTGDSNAYVEARRYKDNNPTRTYSVWAVGRIATVPTHALFRGNNG